MNAMATTTKRSANFDLMRLIASFMVLWSHQFSLTGFAEPILPWVGGYSGLGVWMFFAISGYLNAQSLFRSRSVVTFLASRAVRIFPALMVCVALCIVVGAVVTTTDLHRYFVPERGLMARDAPLSFLWRNSTLLFGLDYQLPGVFEANAFPKAVNGSLWTLPHEVKLYLFLAIVGICCHYRPSLFAGLILAGLAGVLIYGIARPLGPLLEGKYLATFAIVFCAGAALAMIEGQSGIWRAVAAMAVLWLGFILSGNGAVAVLLAVPIVCVVLNRLPLPAWLAPSTDISYGVYLYAFPVQQLTSNLSDNFWLRLAVVVVSVTALGLCSAKWIEQPAQAWRKALKPMVAFGGSRPISS